MKTKTYTITELAKEFDITPRAIRFYEDQGLISPTREGPTGRSRVYTARERTHLKLTLRGKRLGLSLSDIRSLVELYRSPKDTELQLQRFLEVLSRHRAALEQQREDIEIMLEEISTHEQECSEMLSGNFPTAVEEMENSAKLSEFEVKEPDEGVLSSKSS